MLATGALALTITDVGFFSPPPHRPRRSERRTRGGAGVARSLVRALRRELALATADRGIDAVPRVTARYPY